MGRSRQTTRVIFIAAVLLLAVGAAIWMRPAALVSTSPEQGRLLSVTERFGVVEIGDGRKVRVALPTPPPKAGEAVPLLAEHYADGKTRYRIDVDAWRAGQNR
jgi:hypothetical protein